MTQSLRLIAAIGPRAGALKTRHVIGLPGRPHQELPWPHLVVIDASRHGVYLFRYTADRQDCGDTWHESIADAKVQAAFEYEGALGTWYDVPPEAEDLVRYAEAVGLIST